MTPSIIMAAFGTTSKAVETYTHLDKRIRCHYPEEEIIWTYSSKTVTKELQDRDGSEVFHPEKVLRQLAARGVEKAIVQSLHLFPGVEFHSLCELVRKSPVECATGMPLLTTPQDYHEIAEILQPVISHRPEKAILILGHGTNHPVWTAYYSLEKILRKKFGKKIFVGVVEKYPDSSHLVDEIAETGFTEVCIIPLFLVAGMHYRRDIISDKKSSWLSQLEERNISVESIDYGLGLYPGFDKIIIRHIAEAGKSFSTAK
jgi:sirohydrochlorin cobaltochelatase